VTRVLEQEDEDRQREGSPAGRRRTNPTDQWFQQVTHDGRGVKIVQQQVPAEHVPRRAGPEALIRLERRRTLEGGLDRNGMMLMIGAGHARRGISSWIGNPGPWFLTPRYRSFRRKVGPMDTSRTPKGFLEHVTRGN